MGFKEVRARAKENARFQALFNGYAIMDGQLRCPPTLSGRPTRVPIQEVQAEFESGEQNERSTLTRIAAGALIAGPIGAVVGGMVKKDKTKVYVILTFADGRVIVLDAPKKDALSARTFAAKVNAASAHYATHTFGELDES